MHCIIIEKQSNQINRYDDTKKRAHDSQVVRAKENLKLSDGGPSQRQASDTNQLFDTCFNSNFCGYVIGTYISCTGLNVIQFQIQVIVIFEGYWVNVKAAPHDCLILRHR